MNTYHMTSERAKRVLAFHGVPSREEGMIDLLKAAGLQYISGNGLKRGYYLYDAPEAVAGERNPKPIEECSRSQLYPVAKKMYELALDYVPKLASEQYQSKSRSLSGDEKNDRCRAEWRKNMRTWLNLNREEAKEYSTADLEAMLCGE